MPALKAHAQMQPLGAQFEALLAPLRLRLHALQVFRNMTANRSRHPNLQTTCSYNFARSNTSRAPSLRLFSGAKVGNHRSELLKPPGEDPPAQDSTSVRNPHRAAISYTLQPFARSTAFCQRPRRSARSAGSMRGSNRLSPCRFVRNSSGPAQNPVANPARYAAPSAVVSVTCGRTTGTPSTSAWNCINRSFTEAPPSTRSAASGVPVSLWTASSTSATWNAMASSAARAMCPGFVSRRSPISIPAACASQWGAPRPTNAGTNTTPPVSGTEAASASTSPDELISLSLSRSHCTTAPPIKILPSSAYSRRFPALAASVVISRCFERTNSVPTFCSKKQPVPYVFLASPAFQHNCPNSAAC